MSILTEMTDEMCRVYGSGWGGFRPDDGTRASIVLGSYEGKPAIVVIGCVDGVWVPRPPTSVATCSWRCTR